MATWKVWSMNVGFGEKQYTIGQFDGATLIGPNTPRYYKTKKGAERALKKQKEWRMR